LEPLNLKDRPEDIKNNMSGQRKQGSLENVKDPPETVTKGIKPRELPEKPENLK
jgi:hypothetical protein